MCSICTQVNFCTRVHICTPLHVYMHSHILKEVCVNLRKIHLGCKFNSLHLESKGKFVPEFMYFLKTLFTWQKNTQVQICTWMQKYTQVQDSVAHEYVFQSKCYLKTADQGVHNFSEAKFADNSLTQFAFP